MIFHSYEKLEIGSVVTRNFRIDGSKLLPAQPFLIVREATYKEWKAQPETEGSPEPCTIGYYYEVTTD